MVTLRSVLLLPLLIACGDSGDGSGGSGGSAGGAQGGSSQGGAGLVVDCDGDAGFPTFGKACASAADCVVRFHQIDCCGTRVAIGLAADEAHEFDIAEAICETQYPGCGCPQGPTTAEDGATAPSEDVIEVECDASSSCMTFVP